MPRPAVPPEKRRRVARACDSCKRRKERCNGAQPCIICTRRRKEHECLFSDTPARLLRPNQDNSGAESYTSESPLAGDFKDSRHHQMAIDHLMNGSSGQSSLDPVLRSPKNHRGSESSASVPDHARLLRDSEGKFMYVGDSASLSFLQSVRRIVSLAHGECPFTLDPRRHSILETAPTQPMKPSTGHLPIDLHSVKALADQYLLATAGLLDMFDIDTFHSDLEAWAVSPSRDSDEKSCLYYLVLAIGSQVSFANSTPGSAEQYFSRGRQQAFYLFTEAPSLMTVQAYTLITVYMLGDCRRNGAFMNFGIACRATSALGMHLRSTHGIFDEKESRERQSTWRSVRMLDVFFSASLGRPPATCDLAVPKEGKLLKPNEASDISQKVLSLAAIYDRIVIEVYMKKAVSSRLAEAISLQLRLWTQNMPSELDLGSFQPSDEDRLPEIIGATHILSAYHWAIILLTRPFLTSQILQDMNRKANRTNSAEDDLAIKTFADACVDSSLRGLDIVDNLLRYRNLPTRLPFIINGVCNIALVLGAAVFADQDKNFPLENGLERSLRILRHFTPHDPHASRYAEIITYLSDAVKDYIRLRNQQSIEHRSKEVSMLFGSVSHPKDTNSTCPQTSTADLPPAGKRDLGLEGVGPGGQNRETPTPLSFDRDQSYLPDLMTFGNSAAQFPDTFQPPSSVFGDSSLSFPDDAYLFMEQEASIFGFWNGS